MGEEALEAPGTVSAVQMVSDLSGTDSDVLGGDALSTDWLDCL